MLLEFSFNDYRFFKGTNTFNLCPDERTKKMLSNSSVIDDKRVLKALAIYGGNNCGKTNIVRIFKLVKEALMGRDNLSFNNPIFGDSDRNDVSIVYNNLDGLGWMKYEFSYSNSDKKYYKEKLSSIKFYPSNKSFSKILFEKDLDNKVLNIFGDDNSRYLSIIPSTRPLLYSIEVEGGTFSVLKESKESLIKLSNSIEIVSMYNIPINKTINILKEDNSNKKQFILSFVKNADLSVDDFYYSKDPGVIIDKGIIDEKSLGELMQSEDIFHLKTRYGKANVPSLLFDSSGTKKMEAVASYIFEALSEGKTLIVDEIDNGIHFNLTRAIVSIFNNIANVRGQLIFTSHDLLLIDCKFLLRKDQIYFLDREKTKAKIHCLRDYPVSEGGPREGDELLKRYNRGDFGKVPNPNFINSLIKIRDATRDGK